MVVKLFGLTLRHHTPNEYMHTIPNTKLFILRYLHYVYLNYVYLYVILKNILTLFRRQSSIENVILMVH